MSDSLESCGEHSCSTFPFREVYFLSLASQSNIYCCVNLKECSSNSEKLLVGSLRGKVSCIDCSNDDSGNNKPNAKEVYFTYIPGDAEIISMDAFSRENARESFSHNDSMVVAISLVLVKIVNGSKKYQHFLNVYTAMEPEEDHKLEDIARSCQHIELNFTPFQLTHANIITPGEGKQTVFLLSGSDKKIHMFREDTELQSFAEFPCNEYFPEFEDLPSSVTWLDIKETQGNRRMTAFGCQNGFVSLSCIDSDSAIMKSFSTNAEGPISSLRLFTLKSRQNSTEDTGLIDQDELFKKTFTDKEEYHCCEDVCLLVTSALELSVVYLNIFNRGFSNMAILPRSDHFDCVTCSMIADFDSDGDNEVLLGTYGQELLVYKFYPSSPENESLHFDLQWTKTFPNPLFSVRMLDLLNDGTQELVVVSLTGVHILQVETDEAVDRIIKKLELGFRKHLNEATGTHESESQTGHTHLSSYE